MSNGEIDEEEQKACGKIQWRKSPLRSQLYPPYIRYKHRSRPSGAVASFIRAQRRDKLSAAATAARLVVSTFEQVNMKQRWCRVALTHGHRPRHLRGDRQRVHESG